MLTKEAIAEHLWNDNIDLADTYDFIYTHLNNIRKKIKAAGGEDYIKTIYGMGYKFTDQWNSLLKSTAITCFFSAQFCWCFLYQVIFYWKQSFCKTQRRTFYHRKPLSKNKFPKPVSYRILNLLSRLPRLAPVLVTILYSAKYLYLM